MLQMLTTQPKKRNALQNKMYFVVLWAFAVCFFICLCSEHFHHLLSKWWKYFLDLLVLFLFGCVFWSCSALSSLGHRTNQISNVSSLNLYCDFVIIFCGYIHLHINFSLHLNQVWQHFTALLSFLLRSKTFSEWAWRATGRFSDRLTLYRYKRFCASAATYC